MNFDAAFDRLLYWLRKRCLFQRQPIAKPGVQPLVVKPKQGGVVLQDHRPALVVDDDVIRSRTRLLLGGGPSAVAGLVMTVWVNSVKRVAGWARPHVGKKLPGITCPRFTHPNTASAVLLVLRVVRVLAPRLGVVVGLQFGSFSSANAMPVGDGSLRRDIGPMTSTGLDALAPDVVQRDDFLGSAVASKHPIGVPLLRLTAADGGKSAVSLARDVECAHVANYATQGDSQ